jgi:hypothetical protein
MPTAKSGLDSHTASRFSAAGGVCTRVAWAKCPNAAVSVAVTGILSTDTIEAVNAVKFSLTNVKTAGSIAGSTIKAAGAAVILGAAPVGFTGGLLQIVWTQNV